MPLANHRGRTTVPAFSSRTANDAARHKAMLGIARLHNLALTQ